MTNRMLGKLAPVHRPGALMLAAYLPAKHVPVPEVVDNYSHVGDWGMMANDRLGDCTCAAVGHIVQAWTAKNGSEVVLTDDVIVGAYSAITGYDPSDPSSDQGGVETDVLAHWRDRGIGGHRIDSYAIVEPTSEYQVRLATWLFGAVYAGVGLPLSAQDQRVWTVVPGPTAKAGSWGGHAIPILGYNAHRPTCITWGAPLDMTWGWWRKYADEAYACLSLDWVDKKSKETPDHLKWDDLKADLERCFHR